ncbi:MAG: NAD(P)H-hydrate dehydratase [Lachnospiraceae bacterium]
MKQALTASQMQEAERFTIEKLGVPSIVLMERAALAVTNWIMTLYPKTEGFNVILFCGVGNNGADGLAVARQLFQERYGVSVYVVGNTEKATVEFKLQYQILQNMGIAITKITEEKDLKKIPSLDSMVCVDALFGIGCNRTILGIYAHVIQKMNQSRCLSVISVDVPSGIHSSNGEVLGTAVRAHHTITFEFLKTGLLLREGPEYAGEVITEKAGILLQTPSDCYVLEDHDLFRILPKRQIRGNKGTFGKVLCITGCEEMGGAMLLSAKAALKSGCGMVKVATCEKWQGELLHILPEAMVCNRKNMDEQAWKKEFDWCDIVLIGCGLSLGAESEALLTRVLSSCDKMVVVDADGLSLLSSRLSLLEMRKEKGYITVLTPHPGEFARLFSSPVNAQQYQSISFVKMLAQKYGVILVAKDATTITTDGEVTWLNPTGNDGMATAGSGDVLAGMLAGSFARCHDDLQKGAILPGELAACIVSCHGLAGDKAAGKLGKDGVIASDIIDNIF